MNTSLITTIYAATLHLAAVVALTVLIALGKITWADGGPILGGLLGLGAGVPLTLNAVKANTPVPVATVTIPAPPAS